MEHPTEEDKLKKYWEVLRSAEAYLQGGWPVDTSDPPQKLHQPGSRTAARGFDRLRSHFGGNAQDRTQSQAPVETPRPAEQNPGFDSLEQISAEIRTCEKCRLAGNRINAVPGDGAPNPKLMIIGEAPGAQEDASGHAFVGRAGQYLDKWLQAINLDRTRDVFIGNIIKCRPPDNRDPLPDETAACMPYLNRQLDIIQPRAILTLGRISTHILTGTSEGIGKLHGRIYQFRNIPLIPTYHPSGVLRNPVYRKPVWADLQKLQRLIGQQEAGA
ncbi:MAG: uracil-DNA glycosylase [Spirochaetaceae bacterium]|nr:uracil-DNA glycosylase [Spirochaetaceae bacterium]MCF7948214.1 uracil-DNA glycosylase [Spirochaetia bacterium]MCF7951581.1 uracil-DNA glycosylase [Spirochaetaceae bacterium]